MTHDASVKLAPGLAEREDAEAQCPQGEPIPISALLVARELDRDLR